MRNPHTARCAAALLRKLPGGELFAGQQEEKRPAAEKTAWQERPVRQEEGALSAWPLLVRGLFLVGFFEGVEHGASALDMDLDLKDLVQQTADVGACFFGLRSEPLH